MIDKNKLDQTAVKEFFEREDVQSTVCAIANVYKHKNTAETLDTVLRISLGRAMLDDLDNVCKGSKS